MSRIELFNICTRRSGDKRVKVPLELWTRLSRHVKRQQNCETKIAEKEEQEAGGRVGRRGGGGAGVEESSTEWVRMLLRMLVALLFLLVKSGDVELNPGPGLGEYECMV